jgi:hypothetical protein
MSHYLTSMAVGLAGLAGLTVGGAMLLAPPGHASPPAACAAAADWRTAAARLSDYAQTVDPDSTDEWPLVSMAKAYRALAAIGIERESSTVPLTEAITSANAAANRWVTDGWDYVSLLNSGVSTPRQRTLALEEYNASRDGWTNAAEDASARLAKVCPRAF